MCNVCMEIYILASISPFHIIFFNGSTCLGQFKLMKIGIKIDTVLGYNIQHVYVSIPNVVDFMLAGANGCREILGRHWVQDHF